MNRGLFFVAGASIIAGGIVIAGPLTPPAGPIASSYKTLSEVEPRIAVNAVNTPGNAYATYRITQPGSYYLTGNVASESGKDAINISANNVTLDLSGFTLTGGTFGIRVTSGGSIYNLHIRNGRVEGATSEGIAMYGTFGALLENLQVKGCTGAGILTSGNSTVRDCTVFSCNPGIFAGSDARCIDCTVEGCQTANFKFLTNCIFERCISVNSNGAGFSGFYKTTLHDCLVTGSAGVGIKVQDDCLLERCRVTHSGDNAIVAGDGVTIRDCDVALNNADGVSAQGRCSILSNSIHDNALTVATGTGIRVTGDGGVVQNNRVMNNGNWGIYVSGTANLVTGNWTRGHLTTNFTSFPGNDSGQVLNNPGVGFVNSNPWANFTH